MSTEPALSSPGFFAQWEKAASKLAGPVMEEAQQRARLELWRQQEPHDWFRWRLRQRGFDWSKPLRFLIFGLGMILLIGWSLWTEDGYVAAAGAVIWFLLVNLGFLAYFGVKTPLPPPPIPGPFLAGPPLRARMALYSGLRLGRRLDRTVLKIPVSDLTSGPNHPQEWTFELTFPDSMPEPFQKLLDQQRAFFERHHDAPAMAAVCEVVPLSRAQIDAGQHPLRITEWHWDPARTTPFRRA